MNFWALLLVAVGAFGLIGVIGRQAWRLPLWLHPVLVFVGFGGILAGMGLFTLGLLVR